MLGHVWFYKNWLTERLFVNLSRRSLCKETEPWESTCPSHPKHQKTFPTPTHHGYDVVEAIKAMYEAKAKVFIEWEVILFLGNTRHSYTAEALKKCKLTVHVSTKPNRSHLIHGEKALILPVLGRSEVDIQKNGPQFVTVENSMGVHSSQNMPQSE